MDEGDNDPARFFAYLIAGLHQFDGRIGQSLSDILQAPQLPPTELVVTHLINDLSAQTEPLLIVLDDYHVIDAVAIHDIVTFLLEHLTPQIHLVITSRVDPPLPLARLRVHRQLTVLRADDLRFDILEANELLNQTMDLALPDEDITTLAERTEGWIAGLQLATLSLQGRTSTEKQAFLQTFKGDDRYVVDYLVEEVLQHQSPERQAFLLQTAILPRLSASLCNAVTERSDSQQLIAQLEQENIFILPLDNQRKWYRYHKLFAELLELRLYESYPDQVEALHRRAGLWYEEHGFIDDAINQLFQVEDFERAAFLVEQVAERMLWQSGELITLFKWLDHLPDSVLQCQPRLCLYYSLISFWEDTLQAPKRIERLMTAITYEEMDEAVLGEAYTIQASVAFEKGNPAYAIQLYKQALIILQANNSKMVGPLMSVLAFVYRSMGELTQAIRIGTQAAEILEALNWVEPTLLALLDLIQNTIQQGQLHQATRLFHHAEQLAHQWQAQTLPIFGLIYLELFDLFYERNKLETAAAFLNQGFDLCGTKFPRELIRGQLRQAQLLWALGKYASAQKTLEKAEQQNKQQLNPPTETRVLAARLSYFQLLQGQIDQFQLAPDPTDKVVGWYKGRKLALDQFDKADVDAAGQLEYLILARLLIIQDSPAEAVDLLNKLLSLSEANGAKRQAWEALLLQALAFQALGDLIQAHTMLDSVLSQTMSEGHTRLFVDEGEPMVALLTSRAAKPSAHHSYIHTLLAAFPEFSTPERVSPPIPQAPIDPLTDRETEILQLMLEELSSREIANTLIISIDTVRTHIKRIYRKLNVHSRNRAIARAYELGLF